MKRDFFYDEEVIAKKIFDDGFQDGYSRWQATMVAKYFRWTLGYGDARVESSLIKFCKQYDRNFVEVRQARSIREAVSGSRWEYVKKASPISITKAELSVVRSIKNFKAQKILLGFLIYAKRDGGYVNRRQWMSIKRIVGLKIGNHELRSYISMFYGMGIIDIAGINSHFVKFIDQSSSKEIVISDEKTLYNISSLYRQYLGGEPFWCRECGAEFMKNSNRHVYCEECWHKKHNALEKERYHKKKREISFGV